MIEIICRNKYAMLAVVTRVVHTYCVYFPCPVAMADKRTLETPIGYQRRLSNRPAPQARRTFLFAAESAAIYFRTLRTDSAYVNTLAREAHERFCKEQHQREIEKSPRNADAGGTLMIEALVQEVLREAQAAIIAGDMLLHLTSPCCATQACDKVDFKQCVYEVLVSRFSPRVAVH